MSKRIYLSRYTIIINKLKKKGASFEEINRLLMRESEISGDKIEITKRTFQRDLAEIRSLYDIDIQYDFSQKVYLIKETNTNNGHERMLEAYDLFNVLKMSENYAQFIHFEKRKAQGSEYFGPILQAIKSKNVIRFTHLKFWDDFSTLREVEPYLLKECKGRWYLVAKDIKDAKIKTFGLDRISELDILKKKQNTESNLDIENRFKNSFGIIDEENAVVETIELSFSAAQGKYVKAYPLHESQKTIFESESEIVFELSLKISYDFVQELMSFGEELEVLSPDTLRKEMKNALEKTIFYYQNN